MHQSNSAPSTSYLTWGDVMDLRNRLWQRRSLGFLQKLFKPDLSRTALTFDHGFDSSIWNMPLAVRKRLNQLVSGYADIPYEQYVIDTYLADLNSPSLLSIGCGVGSHELYFAMYGNCGLVHGIDLAPRLIHEAGVKAAELGLSNTLFEVKDFLNERFKQKYDVLLFHQSLHHFEDFDDILARFLPEVLKPDGILLINEFVGPKRLQWTPDQLQESNTALKIIPHGYKRIFKTPFYKRKVYRPGLWRMRASDPSESINSGQIRSALHQHLTVIEEKELGGNLLHLVLKDIAHHFCNDSQQTEAVLKRLFALEDAFLQKHNSDFIFGVYKQKQL